jgi:DnaJ-domain-containing protein 1
MLGIIARLRHGRKQLSLGEKHHLMLEALELLHEGRPVEEIAAVLWGRGASDRESSALVAQAQAKFDSELVRSVGLPLSARHDLNYYFLLGVTPLASPERIHRAYRRKAKDVHPDRHEHEFTREYWSRLMTLVSDAEQVLSDPRKRRAYDVLWRNRSHNVALQNRRRGELRGDWETRYRWDVAELTEREDEIGDLLVEIKARVDEGQPAAELGARLLELAEQYEGSILEIRTSAHGLPRAFLQFAGTVRHEMQRKERLVLAMMPLGASLVDVPGKVDKAATLTHVATVVGVIEDIRLAMNQFDINGVE